MIAFAVALPTGPRLAPEARAAVDPASLPGSQGTDTSLPATDSAVTVAGRDAFSGLRISVNQTRNLTAQTVSITWAGGVPTNQPGTFNENYLQIFQCWGDPDGSVPENPGPPPEQCVQGATAASFTPPAALSRLFPSGFQLSRIISRSSWENYDETVGFLDTRTTNVWRPFRAVNGDVVEAHTDPNFNPDIQGGDFWLNPYFDITTTNEIAGAQTGRDGTGSELFQVLTGIESSGLGCGQRVQPLDGGDRKIPQCWIVVVPRGDRVTENAGAPDPVGAGVITSPLAPAAWQNRIAIPIEFNPLDSACSLGSGERRIAGTELVRAAVASWQPALCGTGELPPFSYAPVPDASARQQLEFPTIGSPGMVAIARPLDDQDETNPVLYAPIAASGIVIGFNYERAPRLDAPDAQRLLEGVRVADINLTPRLVAKLLTQSYRSQMPKGDTPEGYDWLAGNPTDLSTDPDFLRFNPEFVQLLVYNQRTFGGLTLPGGNSDAATQVWEWVLADPEAAAWLAGEPDEWGMRVNATFATDPDVNSSGLPFGTPVPKSFPKNDPYCHQEPPIATPGGTVEAPGLCGIDWNPYSRSFTESALITRTAFDGAKVVVNPTPLNSSDVWKRDVPQFLGQRSVLSVTDTASAMRYGVQMARLSRAGDNSAGRVFIAPDEPGLVAGVAAMERSPTAKNVVLPDQTDQPDDAYPLTVVSYAAIAPLSLDAGARADYAAFLRYAAGAGQQPGFEPGDLPRGYVTLPEVMREQTLDTATAVVDLEPAPTTTSTTSTTTTTTTTPPPRPVVPTQSALPPPGGSGGTTRTTTTTSVAPTTSPSTAPATTVPPESTVPETSVPATVPATTEPAPGVTPGIDVSPIRMVIPAAGVVALLAALGVLEITKRPRRPGALDALEAS